MRRRRARQPNPIARFNRRARRASARTAKFVFWRVFF